jgi:hypothetical protein
VSKIEKLIAKALANPGALKFTELVKVANHFGYEQVRQAGSHRIFSKGQGYRRFNFQDFNGEAKIVQVKDLTGYLKEMGWIK